MAIRDRFRRALRKSDSSDTISQTDSNTTASSTRQSSSSGSSRQLQKTASTLSRTFTFGRRDKDKERAKEQENERKKNKNKNTWVHPSEKPLTTQNLKHQEMLGHFTMTFGTTNPSQIYDLDSDGVSPCCTRTCSIDGGSR